MHGIRVHHPPPELRQCEHSRVSTFCALMRSPPPLRRQIVPHMNVGGGSFAGEETPISSASVLSLGTKAENSLPPRFAATFPHVGSRLPENSPPRFLVTPIPVPPSSPLAVDDLTGRQCCTFCLASSKSSGFPPKPPSLLLQHCPTTSVRIAPMSRCRATFFPVKHDTCEPHSTRPRPRRAIHRRTIRRTLV